MKRIKVRTWVKVLFLFIVIISSTILYARYIEPKIYITKEYSIIDSSIPNSFYGFKIVQISDINYKFNNDKSDLNNIVKEINRIKPDIVILTGDLLNDKQEYNSKDIENITKELSNIETTIDKYAIYGDNDYQDKNWETIINDSNFINLNDTYKIIYKPNSQILISGISTTDNDKDTSDKINETSKYLTNNNLYSVLALHEPDTVKDIDYDQFDLILAGHSLGGQFRLPLIGGLIRKKGSKKYVNPHYKIDETDLYISNGLGNDDIEYRFLNKPSFNLFRIRSKN